MKHFKSLLQAKDFEVKVDGSPTGLMRLYSREAGPPFCTSEEPDSHRGHSIL